MPTIKQKNAMAARLLCAAFQNGETQMTRQAMEMTSLFSQESLGSKNKMKAVNQLARRTWERENPDVAWRHPSQKRDTLAAASTVVSTVPQPPPRAKRVQSGGSNKSPRKNRRRKKARQVPQIPTGALGFRMTPGQALKQATHVKSAKERKDEAVIMGNQMWAEERAKDNGMSADAVVAKVERETGITISATTLRKKVNEGKFCHESRSCFIQTLLFAHLVVCCFYL